MKRIIFSNFSKKTKFNSTLSFIKTNFITCFLFVILMTGVVLGAMTSKNADDYMMSGLDSLFNGNFNMKIGQSFIENFITSFTSYFIFAGVSILMGLSLWGTVIIPFVVLLRGFGTGLSGGYLCARYGIIGFSFNSFVLLPGVLLSSIAIVLISRESMNFSVGMLSRTSNLKIFSKYDNYVPMKTFFIRIGMLLFVVALASVVDVLFNMMFAGFFNFDLV